MLRNKNKLKFLESNNLAHMNYLKIENNYYNNII